MPVLEVGQLDNVALGVVRDNLYVMISGLVKRVASGWLYGYPFKEDGN